MTLILHSRGEQGPQTASTTYRIMCEQIALDALIGLLPSAEDKARFYAAHEGLRAAARRSVDA